MKLKDIIYNTKLCLKYPFLYPRNRFTGNHYTSFYLSLKELKILSNEQLILYIHTETKDEYDKEVLNANEINKKQQNTKVIYSSEFTYNNYKITVSTNTINVYKHDKFLKSEKINVSKYVCSPYNLFTVIFKVSTVKPVFAGERTHVNIIIVTNDKEEKHYFDNIKILLGHFTDFKIKCLQYLNKITGIFHILPTYSELDALDKGWRIRFGEDICKDIKHSLIHTYIRELPDDYNTWDYIKAYIKGIKFLYNYRIAQIKEKWGYLHWYDESSTKDIQSIITKYEDISYNTCIVCGKPAVYRTTGWICPYCEEHVPQDSGKVKIGEENNED